MLQTRLFGKTTQRWIQSTAVVNRLRSEWRRDRPPANVKLGTENVIVERKAYGGGKKAKAITVCDGVYTLNSKNVEHTMKIMDVVYSEAGSHYRNDKIINKGAILAVEGLNLIPDLDPLTLLSPDSSDELRSRFEQFTKDGPLLARVVTRPGQVGKCDGYILEGHELDQTLGKIGQ